jgi:hypothetical protein
MVFSLVKNVAGCQCYRQGYHPLALRLPQRRGNPQANARKLTCMRVIGERCPNFSMASVREMEKSPITLHGNGTLDAEFNFVL